MTELEKYQAVNRCETLNELADVIVSFSDKDGLIQGRTRKFNARDMAECCKRFRSLPANCLTREYGIRQQALLILTY